MPERTPEFAAGCFDRWPEGPRTAWAKLDITTAGIAVDGERLGRVLPGYPEQYRTKRSRKLAALRDDRLIDASSGPAPHVPEEVILGFGTGKDSIAKVNYRPDSAVRLACEADGQLWVERPGAYRIPCSLVQARVADGYCTVIGTDRVAALGYEGCSGWMCGTQCLFCDSNPRRPGAASPVPTLNDLRDRFAGDTEAWLGAAATEYFPRLQKSVAAVASTARPHLHLHVMSGNIEDLDRMWRYHLDLGRAVGEVAPLNDVDSYLNLLPPRDPDLLARAREAGFRQVIFNMEVWGDEDYRAVCPEKAKLMPMPLFLERLRNAVGVFGRGNVRCGLVFGAQAEERLRQGCEALAGMGVACSTTVFTPKRGTPWAQRQLPDPRKAAEFSLFLARLLQSYGQRPLYCRLSSRSEILWELLEDEAP
jgi:hypothetical protein